MFDLHLCEHTDTIKDIWIPFLCQATYTKYFRFMRQDDIALVRVLIYPEMRLE